jgi:glycosyltransferase involved in cell wall biosynthesis
MIKEFTIIEGCDFEKYPIGGQSIFARNLAKSFGNQAYLVGISMDDTPVGKWNKKNINSIEYNYFTYAKRKHYSNKPLIPLRIRSYYDIRKYKNEIFSFGPKHVFIQSPEILFEVYDWGWDSICYRFPGVRNPLERPRYKWGRLFNKHFDNTLFKILKNIDVILAAADDIEIDNLVMRSNGKLDKKRVIKFPTRIDTSVFYPIPKEIAKMKLNINGYYPIFVVSGRLSRTKGWELILESYEIILRDYPLSKLFFVGDGEDRGIIENEIKSKNMRENIKLVGMQTSESLAVYLNSSDVVLFASFFEGWPTSIVEALACGNTIVSANVSGVREMVVNGKNGFVVEDRCPFEFADCIKKALKLENATDYSLKLSKNYSIESIKSDLHKYWLSNI